MRGISIATTLVAAAFVLGAGVARAADVDFTVMNQEEPGALHKKAHAACIHKAWEAASPTADQTAKAKMYLGDSKKVVEGSKDAIKAAFKDVWAAWGAYPIDRTAVMTAESEVQAAFAPVKASIRDTGINVLNLLSKDQRTAFDASFVACIKSKGKHHRKPMVLD